ncbi:MAG: helix-turn-helix domain-containing protein [Selenomonadaceae bacterium]|nr:helix-turn-helix domain-containing protein [Selenomonadaceae bacterium]
MNVLDEVMTAAEAAERWRKSSITIRQACTGYKKAPPRFKPDEARRSGATWLITRAGMDRLYGPERGEN